MIKTIPIHFAAGRCSPKNINIHSAVKAGRILLNALALVTPTFRSAKQNRINAITLAKTVRYMTHSKAMLS